jgi:hypothetical protein
MVTVIDLTLDEPPSRTEQPWRCSFCDFNNSSLSPSCERCGRGRGLCSLASSSSIANKKAYTQHQAAGESAYCNKCHGYLLSAAALATHSCSAATPVAKRRKTIGKPGTDARQPGTDARKPEVLLPLVLPIFVTEAEEEILLGAVGVDYTDELESWEYGMCGSRNHTRRYGRWSDGDREDFPKAVIDIVIKRMQSVPQLRGFAPDNVSGDASKGCYDLDFLIAKILCSTLCCSHSLLLLLGSDFPHQLTLICSPTHIHNNRAGQCFDLHQK